MSCSHVKRCVNLLSWLLIGCLLLCSQSGASLLVDTTLDNDYNSKISIPGGEHGHDEVEGAHPQPDPALKVVPVLVIAPVPKKKTNEKKIRDIETYKDVRR